MRSIRRLRALTWGERWLLLKSWALLALVRSSLAIFRFGRTRTWLGRTAQQAVPRLVRSRAEPARIARIVEAASHGVPGGRNCLTRSLTLEALLLRRGHPARIEFGVARAGADGGGSEIEAHAWVTCDGEVLLGGENLDRFVALSSPRDRRSSAGR